MEPGKKKKKVDYEALGSPFMRVPGMRVEVARGLLDLGYQELYELQGRSPDVLFEDMKQVVERHDSIYLGVLRMVVYYVETDQVDLSRMDPMAWL